VTAQGSPNLILALGKTGLAAGKLITEWRHGRTAPRMIGVDFGAPGGFPAAQFVPLDLTGIQYDYQLPPRPLERLAWLEALTSGESSPLFKLWNSQLPRLKQTVLVYLVADLGEPCGSSLIMDAVMLTRLLAERHNVPVAILAYTVIPGDKASEEEQRRAYAALQELAYFTSAANPDQPYPFHYGESLDTTLKTKPFDAWYCFERDSAAVETLAEIINIYLGQQASEVKRQRMVNISGRAAHLANNGPLVGTASVRSLILPMEHLQRCWALELARDSIEKLNSPLLDPQLIRQQRQSFWASFPVSSLESMLFNQRLRISRQTETRPLEERVAELDHLIFPTKSIAPAAFTEAGLNLRSNRFIAHHRRAPQIAEIDETIFRTDRLLHDFGVQDGIVHLSPDNNAYLKLVTDAVQGHLQFFNEMLRQRLSVILKNSGLGTAQAFLTGICEEIQAGQATFDQLLSDPINHDDLYASSRRLRHELLEAGQEGQVIDRKRLRKVFAEFQLGTATYLDSLRMTILLNQGKRLLDNMSAAVTQALEQTALWQQTLANIRDEVSQDLGRIKVFPPFETRFNVMDTPTHPWAQQQRDRYLARSDGLPHLTWHAQSNGTTVEITLFQDSTIIPREQLHSLLMARVEETFRDSLTEVSLLTYLNDNKSGDRLCNLIAWLRRAEQVPLPTNQASRQVTAGVLFAPREEHRADRRTIRRFEAKLKHASNIAPTDNQLIYRETLDDPHRISYLRVTEYINLFDDLPVYTSLSERFHNHHERLKAQIIFEFIAGEP